MEPGRRYGGHAGIDISQSRHLRHRGRARPSTVCGRARSPTRPAPPGPTAVGRRSSRRGTSGRRAPTVFDVAARAGMSSAAVLGDHHLVGAMGAAAADSCWPADGRFGPDVRRDALDYADDAATAEQIAAVLERPPDLVVAQLNGPDTAAHLYGPDSAEAFEAYHYTDDASPPCAGP